MPTPVESGEIVQVLVQGSIENQQCENVWYFRALADDPDMLAHLLLDIAHCLLTALIPALSANYVLEQLKGKVVSPAVGAEALWLPDNDDLVAGQAAGDAQPSFVSALVSLRTTRPGRSGRGRIYFPGIPEGDTVGSLIGVETPLWAALLAFTTCMLDKFKSRDVPAAGNYDWGVMSRKIGGLKPPFLPAGYAQILSATPSRELATTRSRKLGRGR